MNAPLRSISTPLIAPAASAASFAAVLPALVLLAAIVLSAAGCGGSDGEPGTEVEIRTETGKDADRQLHDKRIDGLLTLWPASFVTCAAAGPPPGPDLAAGKLVFVGFMGPDGSVSIPSRDVSLAVWIHRADTDRLYTPLMKDSGLHLSLAQDGLPFPRARWRAGEGIEVLTELSALQPSGEDGHQFFHYRIQLFNMTSSQLRAKVYVLIGHRGQASSSAHWLDLEGSVLTAHDKPVLRSSLQPAQFVKFSEIAQFEDRDSITPLIRLNPEAPQDNAVEPGRGIAPSLCYDVTVAPGGGDYAASTPVWDLRILIPADAFSGWPEEKEVLERYARAHIAWSGDELLGRVKYTLPDRNLLNAYQSSLGQLILAANAGFSGLGRTAAPDEQFRVLETAAGAMALNRAGRFADARRVLNVFKTAIGDDGELHVNKSVEGIHSGEAAGRALTALVDHYRFTRDRDWLAGMWPRIAAAAGRLVERLKPVAETLIPRETPYPEKERPLRYADAFWALTGLEEAAFAAEVLGRDEEAVLFGNGARKLRETLYASVRASMDAAKLNFIPAEPRFGPDGDIQPLDALPLGAGAWPGTLFTPRDRWAARSFEIFYEKWCRDPEGAVRLGHRILGTGLELGLPLISLRRPDYADRLIDWYAGHSSLPGTYTWTEVMDLSGPAMTAFSIGSSDSLEPSDPIGSTVTAGHRVTGPPSIRAAAACVTLLRNMLAMEQDDYIVLAPGVTQRWLDLHGEIAVENLPTFHGSLSYRLQSDDDKVVFDLMHSTAIPPKGYIYYQLYDSPDAPIKVDGKPYDYAIRDQTIILPRGAKRIEIQW